MIKTFSKTLSLFLSLGLACPQLSLAASPADAKSALQRVNYFAYAVAQDAAEAFKTKDLVHFAYRMGYVEKQDVDFLTQQYALNDIRELPQLSYENGQVVLNLQGKIVTLEFKDRKGEQMLINGQRYTFVQADTLKEAYDLNLRNMLTLIEKTKTADSPMSYIFPEAQASFWGWALAIGLIVVPLSISIGRKQDLKKGAKDYGKNMKNLGKAIFSEGPKALWNDGFGAAHDVNWDATKQLYKGEDKSAKH